MGRLSPARTAALEATAQVRKRDAFVRDVLPAVLSNHDLHGSDRALASLLAIGVVQTQGTLDEVLDRSMNSPKDVKADLRDALRIPIYEMLYLERDPYVAVDQGVELAARVSPRAKGLANAVLRRSVKVAASFPFGDDATDVEAAALRFGFPVWLAREIEDWQGVDGARRFMSASNGRPPVFLSVNSLRISDAEAARMLQEAEVPFVASNGLPGCVKLENAADVGSHAVLRMIEAGQLVVSDAAAQEVARRVVSVTDDSLLEIGAGRGTKTVLLQNESNRLRGSQIERLVCVDNVAGKADLLRDKVQRCSAHVSEVVTADATDLVPSLGDERFSCVFIDAPCTGLGTLRRHPEIRWRMGPRSMEEASKLDARLLDSAARHVATGGCLVYATCTISPEENDRAVDAFLSTPTGAPFKLLPGEDGIWNSSLTDGGCDSHFCAIMVKDTESDLELN